jgi:hypothetical protein
MSDVKSENGACNGPSVTARLAPRGFWATVHQAFGAGGGVYFLSCATGEDDLTPVPVNRLLGQDRRGILYIGKADSFVDRVIGLKKSLSPEHRTSEHECGVRHKSHLNLAAAFPYERLVLTLIGSTEPRQLEATELKRYLAQFGELPPLNRAS